MASQTAVGETKPRAEWQTLAIAAAKAESAELATLDDQSVLATPAFRETYVIDAAPLAGGHEGRLVAAALHSSRIAAQVGPRPGDQRQSGAERGRVYLGEERLALVSASADHSQKNYPVASLIDDDPGTGWAINVEPGATVKMNAEHAVVLDARAGHRRAATARCGSCSSTS